MADRSGSYLKETQQEWRCVYLRQLDRQLDLSLAYLSTSPAAHIHTHMRSFLTLLNETRRFPSLSPKVFRLISLLHPFPLRWGLGNLWAAELRFAIHHVPSGQADLKAVYLCSLGDVYQFKGQFEKAITACEKVLHMPAASAEQAARAVRILFTCYRARGQPERADGLIARRSALFFGERPAAEIPAYMAQAWLRFQQCRLELLRERGEIDPALALVKDMLWLDEREGSPEKTLTADLYTHHSTLLWVRSRYPEAVNALKRAMQLYAQAEDQFNAESLKSNLGLVYWTMGELGRAEEMLLSAIRFYRETGSEQLLTYDIGNLGLVYFARGELDDALSLTQEHIDLAQRIHFVHEYYRGRRNLGTLYYYLGEYERSMAETSAGHEYYETRGSRDAYGLDILWLALCQFKLGKPDRALSLAYETLEWGKALKSRVLEQLTLRCLAEFLPREEREAPLLRSLELACAMGRKLEEAAVRLSLAGVYSGAQRAQEWQAGVAILREAGAEKWLAGRSPENAPVFPLML